MMTERRPLSGFKVVSLAQQYPGPYATLLLSDLGAEVLQIESPDGDPARRHPAFFEAVNRNKTGLRLNLKSEDDRQVLYEHLENVDAFIEGFKPGTAERLGVGRANLKQRFPSLVYVSISAFGQTGPYRDRPAHDLSIVALAGMLHGKERSCLDSPYVGHADLVAGMFAAFAVVTGLLQRQSCQHAPYVDVSMADCLVSWMTAVISPAATDGHLNDPDFPAYGAFECRDKRWISLSVIEEDHMWRGLCVAFECDEVAALTFAERQQQCEVLRNLLRTKCKVLDWAEVGRRLDAHGVAWSPVLAPAEVTQDEHFVSRKMFQRLPSPMGPYLHVTQPLTFDDVKYGPHKGAPRLG